MPAEPWRTAVVTRIEEEAEGTRRYYFSVPELEQFDFKPGQFVTLDLPIHEKPNKRWRSYSIASWPDGTNGFELCIVLLEGGVGTHYIFEEFKVGTEVQYRGPSGVFTLPPSLHKDLYFICTGTGIAPFRSMLHHILDHNIPHQSIYLIFGTRTRGNLLYYDEMRQLATDIPQFHYVPTLSREEWEGRKGYVHQVYEDLLKKNQTRSGPVDECGAAFYLCGWKDMIDEAKKRIQEMGFDRKCIHQELYG
ncbi:MAG: oxidoreductase [Chitinophagaceae bacterium]|nr:MAG: oxidoreductase [Chitinophagaceae bacterium]